MWQEEERSESQMARMTRMEMRERRSLGLRLFIASWEAMLLLLRA